MPFAYYNRLSAAQKRVYRTSDAIDHLRQAIEASEKFVADAREDSDLDPIRDEPPFQALIAE